MSFDGCYRRPAGGYVQSSHEVSSSGADFTTGPEYVFPSGGTHYADPNRNTTREGDGPSPCASTMQGETS